MIAYRINPRYPAMRDVRSRPMPSWRPVHNLKTSPDQLGPYRDRANARHALRDFAMRQGRPRGDFEVYPSREGFRVRLRPSLPAEVRS